LRIAVIGAGPVGIFFTKLCLDNNLSVALVESGNEHSESSHLTKKNYIFNSPSALPEGVHRVGGGSTLWRARLSEFQESDFSNLDNNRIWPFSKSELEVHYKKVYNLLNAGDLTDHEVINQYFGNEKKILPEEFELRTFRFCDPRFFIDLFKDISKHKKLEILTDNYCTKIFRHSSSGELNIQLMSRDLNPISREFDKVIIACGAFQSTALIQRSPMLITKNSSLALGKNLMEHCEGFIGTLTVKNIFEKDLFSKLSLDSFNRAINELNGIGIAISNHVVNANKLINVHYEIRKFMPRFYFRARKNVTKNYLLIMQSLSIIEKYIYFTYRKMRAIHDIIFGIKRFSIYLKAEELPYINSKIDLDNDNTSISNYQHKISNDTYQLISEDIKQFQKNFKKYYSSKLKLHKKTRNLRENSNCFGPNWHPMGTTRMGIETSPSVCNKNLEIHADKDCFILSASVFPSGSNSNPTFTTLALASRLSDYISKSL
jgi:choline dehydrogenase-like flavoprotein